MVQEQARIQIILEVHLQNTTMFVNVEKLSAGCLLFVLAGTCLPLSLLADHVFPLDTDGVGNHRQSLGQPFPCGTLVD